jgi:hypothetical protein
MLYALILAGSVRCVEWRNVATPGHGLQAASPRSQLVDAGQPPSVRPESF